MGPRPLRPTLPDRPHAHSPPPFHALLQPPKLPPEISHSQRLTRLREKEREREREGKRKRRHTSRWSETWVEPRDAPLADAAPTPAKQGRFRNDETRGAVQCRTCKTAGHPRRCFCSTLGHATASQSIALKVQGTAARRRTVGIEQETNTEKPSRRYFRLRIIEYQPAL